LRRDDGSQEGAADQPPAAVAEQRVAAEWLRHSHPGLLRDGGALGREHATDRTTASQDHGTPAAAPATCTAASGDTVYSAEDEEKIAERLKSLGYVE